MQPYNLNKVDDKKFDQLVAFRKQNKGPVNTTNEEEKEEVVVNEQPEGGGEGFLREIGKKMKAMLSHEQFNTVPLEMVIEDDPVAQRADK